jgi:type VII secretion protein EccCa
MTARKFTPKYPAGPQPVANEVELATPPELGEEIEQKGWHKYLPALMIGAIVLLIGIMIYSGVRAFSPLYMMMPAFFIIMGIGYLTNMGSQSKSVPELDARRKVFLRYLTGLRPRVAASAAQQIHYWSYHAPNPADLSGLVGGTRQWSRQSRHDLFCAARIGTGAVPADDKLLQPAALDSKPMSAAAPALVGPSAAPQPYLEPVTHVWLVKFVRTHGLIHDCPKVINLRTHPTVSIGGDPARAAGLLRAMICHLALFHAPEDLQIRVVTANAADPDWTWLKWLPHIHHPSLEGPSGKVRLIYPDDDSAIGSELSSRSPHASATANPAGPYHLVINLTGQTTYPQDGKAGVTYITLGQTRASYQIKVDDDGTVYDRQPKGPAKARQWQLLGDADNLEQTDATRIARRLAGWTTSGDQVAAPVPTPTRIDTHWHCLIGARTVEEITSQRWQPMPDISPNRLRFPVGHLHTGEVCYVDIKEGSDGGNGPHGMLIGMTGSGKSQFLTTLLLSAVSTHHPSQLNLLCTDFKGGTTFQGMENLPHVAAIVTNLEGDASLVERMDDAIRGEIERREEIINAAARSLGRSVPDVREYERLREAGYPLEPMPALFIVVDEFAMLLNAHPEFNDLFQAVCTVGRGLRIHFLLATQTLENCNLTKISPNTHYRIALRTASPTESKQVIDTPEAAYIESTEPGTGYIRFTRNEDPQKFRAARTDLAYAPSDFTAPAPPPSPAAEPIIHRVRAFTGYDVEQPAQESRHARTAS